MSPSACAVCLMLILKLQFNGTSAPRENDSTDTLLVVCVRCGTPPIPPPPFLPPILLTIKHTHTHTQREWMLDERHRHASFCYLSVYAALHCIAPESPGIQLNGQEQRKIRNKDPFMSLFAIQRSYDKLIFGFIF